MITFTSDFGTSDGYTGIVKGVILSLCPGAQIVDLSHDVPSHDIRSAAWIIHNSYRYFPNRTVHLLVVDPGVGSGQKRIVLSNGEHTFLGADNGCFSGVLSDEQRWQAYELSDSRYFLKSVSNTFHGRDIFAPAAAHLLGGVDPSAFGAAVELESLVRLPPLKLCQENHVIEGAVAYVDKYGNLISNIPEGLLTKNALCRIDEQRMILHKTYASVEKGQAVAFVGSHGYLEVAVNGGSAARSFGVSTGCPVYVELQC